VPADQITGPRVISFGIDALVLGFRCNLAGHLRMVIGFAVADEHDKRHKKDAAKAGRDPVVRLGGVTWQVLAGQGKNRDAILKCEHARVTIGKEAQTTTPNLSFNFSASTLWNLGLEGAWRWAEGVAQNVHDESEGEGDVLPVLSRLDLTMDVLNVDFCHDESTGPVWCTRANMTRYDDGKIPVEDKEGIGQRTYHRAANYCTGWSWGKGQQVSRIYRKCEEILAISGKTWFLELWAAQGGVLIGLKRDKDRVWRIEYQLRRELLKKFVVAMYREGKLHSGTLDSLEALKTALPLLWRYCTGSRTTSGWLSWRVKDGLDDAKRSTWRHRDEWRMIQQGPEKFGYEFHGEPLKLDNSRRVRAEAMVPALGGYLETMAAELTWEETEADLDKVWEWFRTRYLDLLKERADTFGRRVLKKAAGCNSDLTDAIKTNRALAERAAQEDEHRDEVMEQIVGGLRIENERRT